MVSKHLFWDKAVLSHIIQQLAPEESLCKLELHSVNRTFYGAIKETIPKLMLHYQKLPSEKPKDNETMKKSRLKSLLEGIDEHEVRKIYAMNHW